VQEKAATVRTLLEQGRIFGEGEALDRLEAIAESPGASEQDPYVRAARQLFERVVPRLKYARDETGDSDFLLNVVGRLEEPKVQELFRAAFPAGQYDQEFRRTLNEYGGAAHLLRGRSAVEGQGDLKTAQREFAEAADLLGPQDFLNDEVVDLQSYRWARFWQIRTLREELSRVPPDQLRALAPVDAEIQRLFKEARRGDLPLSEELYKALLYEEEWYRTNRLIYFTEIAPAATPPPTPNWTALPSPTPTPSPTEEVSGVSNAFKKLKKGALKEAWNSLMGSLGAFSVYIIPALYVIGGLLAWIYIPRGILRMRERRADIHAARFRTWPRLAAPFALIAYIFTAIKERPKRGRHKCPFCNFSLDDIESYAEMNFLACPNCHQTITPVYDLEDYIEYLVEAVKRELEMSKMGAVNLKAVIEKDAMAKLVRAIITLAVRRRASDLHVEPEAEGVKIRARIDGMLQELTTMPKVMASPLVSALKVMGNLDIAERRVPQDGRFQIWVDKADIDIRIASAPSALGEKCSLRLLDSRSINVDPSRLGMDEQTTSIFESTIRKPHGMLLVTGPTGSGKSTTLYVALQQINTGEKNIISVEDPIEFKIKGVNQMQVNPAANFTFATGLRSILRQDPDVIMVGEVRDRETADIAIEAAMTGHLVLSTLHTIDAASAIGRLVDLGVEPRRFADALQLIIAQRLLRLNCSECAKPYRPKKSEWDAVGIDEEALGQDEWKPMKGTGCDVCRFTGFFGRMGLFEMLVPDEEIRDAIERKVNTSKIRHAAKAKGMKSLREQGLDRVKEGLTTLEEVIRVTA
jgi:type IV pilus assembly protein PilB